MPRVELKVKVTTDARVLISPQEFFAKYSFGISPGTQDGATWDDSYIASIIRDAQRMIEDHLDTRIPLQCIEETFDYNREDYQSWGYTPTTFPVRKGFQMEARINDSPQIIIPSEWIVTKRNSDLIYQRAFTFIPNTTGATSGQGFALFVGLTPHIGILGSKTIPQYWHVKYATGWRPAETPRNILDFIGLVSAIGIYIQLGDVALGAGLSSKSISIDGLSTSLSTTQSATSSGFGARLIELRKTYKDSLDLLERMYRGINLTVL